MSVFDKFGRSKDLPHAGHVSEPRPAQSEIPTPAAEMGQSAALDQNIVSDADEIRQMRLLAAKVDIHQKLLDALNLQLVENAPRSVLRNLIEPIVGEEVRGRNIALNKVAYETFVDEIIDEMVGLGPLETLLQDESIADILINSHRNVYIERNGRLESSNVRFRDEDHLLRIINKIVSAVGRRVDESAPMCDARLADGSRINVVVRPIAIDGSAVSIRKFQKKKLSVQRLIDAGAIRPPMAEILTKAVWGKVTTIVSGGTGSGKTTMLNALSAAISEGERLITIEDAAELQLQQPHVVRLETRPPSLEGKGEIRQRELVKNALRMRPDRIILGEVRGEEAFDMLQAMNTGHEGSLATVHANSPRDALSRIEQMVAMSGYNITPSGIRAQIAAAIGLIVQLQRQTDGTRKVVSISEITGMEGDIVQMQEIYAFKKLGTTSDGKVVGEFRASGVRPRFAEALQTRGVVFSGSYFDPNKPL